MVFSYCCEVVRNKTGKGVTPDLSAGGFLPHRGGEEERPGKQLASLPFSVSASAHVERCVTALCHLTRHLQQHSQFKRI